MTPAPRSNLLSNYMPVTGGAREGGGGALQGRPAGRQCELEQTALLRDCLRLQALLCLRLQPNASMPQPDASRSQPHASLTRRPEASRWSPAGLLAKEETSGDEGRHQVASKLRRRLVAGLVAGGCAAPGSVCGFGGGGVVGRVCRQIGVNLPVHPLGRALLPGGSIAKASSQPAPCTHPLWGRKGGLCVCGGGRGY